MKKIVALILCLFMCFSLAACSFSWDEQTSITSASVVYDEKADKYYLELVYESGDVSRIEVTDLSALRGDSGSKGDKGDNGNGIAEIITKNNGIETEVTIKFTSEEMKDVTFSIPNGEYVSNVQIFEADETHEGPYLVFTFSGSTEPKEISLPRGKDGVGNYLIRRNDQRYSDSRRNRNIGNHPFGKRRKLRTYNKLYRRNKRNFRFFKAESVVKRGKYSRFFARQRR